MKQEYEDTHHSNTVQSKIIADLKAMMWERHRPVVTRKLTARYLENDAFMRWSAAYQPQVYTNMETNNYIESWHKNSKITYPVKDVLPEYNYNISRIFLKVGRMGPEERRHRTRDIQEEDTSADALKQIIEMQPLILMVGVFMLLLLSQLQVYPDFCFNNIACKHMYLLKRDMSWLFVFEASFDPTFSTIPQNSPDSSALLTPTEQAPLTASSNSSTDFDTLLSNIHKLKRRQYTLTETELEELTSFNHWFLSRIDSTNNSFQF
ncbi:hypothetical protein INT47_012351 [Mucor saturninus]|uniref:Uncharacterized protein n=1 Tax=Mucor saturninus TaxID=64648 RepID=A0A8H7QZ85_9FUNG|nr:hypothetical protein INT47_012351 [Mucor saturninus]